MTPRTILFLLTTFVMGCANSPPRQPPTLPFPVPPSFGKEVTTEPTTDRWYRSFGDRQLEQYVEEALAAHPSLAVASARIDQAHAQATIVGADSLPSANLSAGAQRQRSQFFAPGFGPQTNRITTHSLALNFSWELDLWGRVRAGRSAAIADVDAALASYAGAELSLTGQVTRAYFIASARALLAELAELDTTSARSLTRRIEDRFRGGLRPALDYRLALADLASAESRLATAREERTLARRQLEILLARYPEGRIAIAAELPDVPERVPGDVPAELLRRRPDLVIAERRVAAADRRELEAKRSLLPRIALTSSAGTVTEDVKDLLDLDFSIWSLAANLTQPLFEGGRLRANVDLRRAQADEAAATFVESALRAFSEVESALARSEPLRAREEALARAMEESKASLDISEARYLEGVVDLVDLLQTRRAYFAARTNHLLARLDLLTNRVDLHLALGGGFEDESHGERP